MLLAGQIIAFVVIVLSIISIIDTSSHYYVPTKRTIVGKDIIIILYVLAYLTQSVAG